MAKHKIKSPTGKKNKNAIRGIFFESFTFKVCPLIFDKNLNYMASTHIHELMHVWFKDPKLGAKQVYGEHVALD